MKYPNCHFQNHPDSVAEYSKHSDPTNNLDPAFDNLPSPFDLNILASGSNFGHNWVYCPTTGLR